jgi:hypothetical protein
MQIKVVTLNEDGSIAFEGAFGPNEVRFIMELGTNILLQQGAIPFVDEDEEDDDEDDDTTFDMEGPETVQ